MILVGKKSSLNAFPIVLLVHFVLIDWATDGNSLIVARLPLL